MGWIVQKIFLKRTQYLVWYHLVILIGVSNSAVNWPVFFENMGNVNSIHNKWEITFIYKSRFAEMENRISNLTLTMNNLKLDKVWKKDAKNNTDSVFSEKDQLLQMSQKLLRKIRLFGAYGPKQKSRSKRQGVPEYKINRKGMPEPRKKMEDVTEHKIKRQAVSESRKKREDTERQGVPDFWTIVDSMNPKSRLKRQARGIVESMFGVVSKSTLNELQDEVNRLKEKQETEFWDLEQKQNKISSTTKRELHNTMSMVKKVEAMTGLLENKLTVMERNSPQDAIKLTIRKKLQSIGEELEDISTYLDSVDNILECLGSGRLSRLVVPGHTLRNQLARVEDSIPEHFTLLYPSEESLWPYYTVIPCRMFMSDDYEEIVAHVSVPLIDSQHVFNLHKIHNLPMKIRDGYSVTADIKTEYLLTDKTGDYYMELGKEDFQDCQVYTKDSQVFFCGFGPLLQTSKSASCVIQLFNIEGEGELCQSKLSHGLMQPFTRLYNGSWVFAAINSEIPVTMKCQNNTMKMALFGFGVLNLMDGCTLTSEQFLYPHTFSGHFEVPISDDDDDESTYKEEKDLDNSEEEDDLKTYVLDKKKSTKNALNVAKPNFNNKKSSNNLVLKEDLIVKASTPRSPPSSGNTKKTTTKHLGAHIDNTVKKVLNVLSPSEYEATTIHYNVLVKLKDQIKKGDNWIDKYNKGKKIINVH